MRGKCEVMTRWQNRKVWNVIHNKIVDYNFMFLSDWIFVEHFSNASVAFRRAPQGARKLLNNVCLCNCINNNECIYTAHGGIQNDGTGLHWVGRLGSVGHGGGEQRALTCINPIWSPIQFEAEPRYLECICMRIHAGQFTLHACVWVPLHSTIYHSAHEVGESHLFLFKKSVSYLRKWGQHIPASNNITPSRRRHQVVEI